MWKCPDQLMASQALLTLHTTFALRSTPRGSERTDTVHACACLWD
jgi:hypothetical protein